FDRRVRSSAAQQPGTGDRLPAHTAFKTDQHIVFEPIQGLTCFPISRFSAHWESVFDAISHTDLLWLPLKGPFLPVRAVQFYLDLADIGGCCYSGAGRIAIDVHFPRH